MNKKVDKQIFYCGLGLVTIDVQTRKSSLLKEWAENKKAFFF
jgi:hypothetical protein